MSKKFAIKINKISKSFDEKKVLDNISFSLYFGQKVALIGSNGGGKSTIAKIIIGEIKPDGGNIEIFPNFYISYLPQEINENIFVEEYIEKKSKTFELLEKFGFSEEIFHRKISSLSGGEKTKIFLIKISLENAQVIILDEPTNNLDEAGLVYLEKIIKNSNSAFLIVSHDRSFLDKTVSKIIFLNSDSHQIKSYDGNYSDFIEKRKSENERQNILAGENQRKKKKIEGEISTLQSRASVNKKVSFSNDNDKYIDFNKTARNLKKNSKRLKAVKVKLENFEEKEKTITKRPLKIDFSEMKNSGNKVLEIKNLKLNYGFSKEINGEFFSGSRILISGKNGSGKTTFIKTILENFEENKISQNIFWGTNIILGYLPQVLKYGNKTESFLNYFIKKTKKDQKDARKILSRFGFGRDEVFSKISELSPGLRSRGKIAIMLANNPNVLILDEPTNNLDLEVLEKLENALVDYKGTIIFVSHDKYFIEKIKPTKIINLDN